MPFYIKEDLEMENKMGYAYLDKYGILHIVSSVSSVPTGTKFVGTQITHKGGFPVVRKNRKDKKIYMYSLEEAYIGGNRNSYQAQPPTAVKMDFEEYPHILELYKKCM